MNIIANETLGRLSELLKLPVLETTDGLNVLADIDHRYLKDLKINTGNALSYNNLSKKESYLLALALVVNEKNKKLIQAFTKLVIDEGATTNEIAEVYACVSLMNVNNVFYRFRHFTNKEYYNQTTPGIKMNIMVNPVVGKEFFELISMAISAANGCERCVNAHEQSLLQLGCSEARIYDAVRAVAIMKGLSVLL